MIRNKKGQFVKGHPDLAKNKGRIHTLETRHKFALAKMGKKGNHTGYKHSDETKKYISQIQIGKMVGENNPAWKGGNSPQYRIKFAPRPKPEQCELCGVLSSDLKKGLCFDHDHKTGKFRGWICMRCNLSLGLVKDNIELLDSMIKYLIKNNEI